MKRTRKWHFVEQEASRLAALGLSASEIARRLGVNKSSVARWLNSGQLTRGGRRQKRARATFRVKPGQTPAKWSATVRQDYDLDATDNQLVTLAEMALADARDQANPASVRLAASGRYQALVKQLALVARSADGDTKPEPKEPPTPAALPRVVQARPDPRTILLAVK